MPEHCSTPVSPGDSSPWSVVTFLDLQRRNVFGTVTELRRMPTAARSGEVRLATRDEMDTKDRVWTISALRMKAKREHRVPLCGRAVEILNAARALGDGSSLVFPMREADVGIDAAEGAPAPRDRRRTSRRPVVVPGWAAEETHQPLEVIKAALPHAVQNKVEAAYARSDLFERRRLLMVDWAEHLAGRGTVMRP